MIHTDTTILKEIENGNIIIEPFNRENLGTNSYDVTLGKTLKVYKDQYSQSFLTKMWRKFFPKPLDVKNKNPETIEIEIPESGLILKPSEMYLGVTVEYTGTHNAVPILEGKSSLARLALKIHETAGFGDVGFCNHWTLEITVVYPTRIYPNMKIGQLSYHSITEKPLISYNKKASAKYTEVSNKPQASKMGENF